MKNQSRNIGLDILRVMSIFFIILGHMRSESFIRNLSPSDGRLDYIFENIVGNAPRLSINCFMMISAWFLIGRSFSGKRFVSSWLMVFLLNVSVTMAAVVLGVAPINSVYVFQAFLPIVGRPQWYMCEYLLLLLTAPFLNEVINNINRRQLKTIIEIGVVFIVLIETILIIPTDYTTPLFSEYSWFVFLYFLIAYIKKYDDSFLNRLTRLQWGVIAVLCYCVISAFALAAGDSDNLLVKCIATHYAEDYAALPGLACSLGLFQLMKNKSQGQDARHRLLSVVARNTGYIYIIHSVPVLWRFDDFKIWNNIFHIRYWYNNGVLIPAMLVTTIIVMAIGSAVGEVCSWCVIPYIRKMHIMVIIEKRLESLYR